MSVIAGIVALIAATTSASPAVVDASLFVISKSENKNQVQYVIRLDDHCAASSDAPVHAFWRMLEQGPTATQPLLPREEAAYGIATQSVLRRGPQGSAVRLMLRALPDRQILIETMRSGSGCLALSTVAIAGVPAHLYNVHASIRWPFGLDYLLLSGWSMDGKRIVREKIDR